MTNTLKSLMAAGLLAAVIGVPGLGYAGGPEGGAAFPDTVGTHIYSPGPMAPAQPFRLEMQMSMPAMKVIHTDMMMHPSVAGTTKIACTMQPVPHHRGMVVLTCTPGA
ncbi:hypothetical protein AruPA_13700 [Acidiphilium sp. PA]|uniref:hypothetical protein n=1 Tax=Acidiphilium sp. PA TaxID=2871705 RepID=UPI0022443965|nr:hypothetical protein [Acidiphilium sp. PA]MCW8308095.1 hypothetical protein [Acidiphilium sp. PA]